MPFRSYVTREFGALLGVLSHPNRLQIVEELNRGEMDVNALQGVLGISHSGVSQHLALLRAHRVGTERREGRRVIYRLRQPELATWLIDGLSFLEGASGEAEELRSAVESARAHWTAASESQEG